MAGTMIQHMEGDALNVAHLVPLARRLSRSGLLDALTAHYGSPGRLADYRRQFEQTTRKVGEDPAIFATALETANCRRSEITGLYLVVCTVAVWSQFNAGNFKYFLI